ncbi:MAG: rod shape-determining protein MreD, partial [Acetobacteraceae bacterium]|nr:rod shape-determining protein MreD [Acetobacteraceae bacterium]
PFVGPEARASGLEPGGGRVRLKAEHLVLAGLVVLAVVLEQGVLPFVAWRGVKPDLTLILAVLAGLVFGSRAGATVGACAGLLQDLHLGRYLGLAATGHMAAGFLAGLAERRLFKENLWVPLLAGGLATVVNEGVTLLLLRLVGTRLAFGPALVRVVLPSALYNALLTPVLYWPFVRLNARLGRHPPAPAGD